MSWIDALIHSFTTLSLGGFSSHDASIALLRFARDRARRDRLHDARRNQLRDAFPGMADAQPRRRARTTRELPYYLAVLAAERRSASPAFLWVHGRLSGLSRRALRYAAFNTISVATNTGYATVDYAQWPVFAPLWLMFLGTFVACSGSAGGGIKMIRAMILFRQMYARAQQARAPERRHRRSRSATASCRTRWCSPCSRSSSPGSRRSSA